jgi:hypothetical protein
MNIVDRTMFSQPDSIHLSLSGRGRGEGEMVRPVNCPKSSQPVLVLVLAVFWALIVPVFASTSDKQTDKKPTIQKQEKDTKETVAFVSAELAVLDRFAGPWNVSESHFNARGDVVGSSKGIEEGAWVLDHKALRRTYTTGQEGSLFRAIGMIAWDAAEKRYKGAWFDNTSTSGPTTLTGTWDEPSKTMTFSLSSTAPDGKALQHKVIDRFLDDEHRIATTFRVDGTQVEKVIEVQYTRAVPCPPSVGIVVPEGAKSRE